MEMWNEAKEWFADHSEQVTLAIGGVGESMPVDKVVGDEVFSGTVNQFGALDMKTTKAGEDSSIQRMIKLVKETDPGNAKIVSLADRWATWIVVMALITAVGTYVVTGEMIRAVVTLWKNWRRLMSSHSIKQVR